MKNFLTIFNKKKQQNKSVPIRDIQEENNHNILNQPYNSNYIQNNIGQSTQRQM